MTSNMILIFFSLLLFTSATNSLNEEDDFEDTIIEGNLENEQQNQKYVPPRYQAPEIDTSKTYFLELFDDKGAIGKKWFKSESKKEGAEEAISKYDGEWSIGEPTDVIVEKDYGLIVRTKARHHAIAAKLGRPFKFDGKPFVLQYEVKYEEGQECGGGYLKLLETGVVDSDLRQFNDKSPYVVMFGPDKCGISGKIHFIVRHKNPKNGTVNEHHAKQSNKQVNTYFDDKKTHLYTLVINSDNTFHVSVDKNELISGNLLTDLEPPITPPKQIPDPSDQKPSEWDDRVMVDDPEAKKPNDWDETQPKEIVDEDAVKPADWLEEEEPLIPDLEAEKPADWDDEMDGEWEPRKLPNEKCKERSGCGKWTKPMKANPLYRGKWTAPRISNPNYKGPWSPKLVDNPHYFEGIQLEPISAVGIELWTMSSGIVFDNILVAEDANVAKSLAEQTFDMKKAQEKAYQSASADSNSFLKSVMDATEEKPWLWAVIILAVLVPVVLVSIFCFGRKTPRDDRKKTDEPVEDTEMEEMEQMGTQEREEQDEEEEEGGEGIGDAAQQSSASASSASSQTGSKPPTPDLEKKELIGDDASAPPEETVSSSANATTSSPRPTKRIRARRQD